MSASPPYVTEEEGRGIEPNLLREAFRNRVFILCRTRISTLDDMKTLRVSAFQRTRQVLGGAFAPMHSHVVFRKAVQQRWFDRQLDAMRADGRYQKIFETYGATP